MNTHELSKQATQFLNKHGYSRRGLPLSEEQKIKKYKAKYEARIKKGHIIRIEVQRPQVVHK